MFPGSGQPDGTISLNILSTTPGSPASNAQYSLLAVTEHEINEVLGLGSSLPNIFNGDIFPEDLFRYTSPGIRSFTAAAATSYFSIDGTTMLMPFNNTADGGDYGDYAKSGSPKVQDAFATPGAFPSLSDFEMMPLDVIGYNRITPANVPEPASIALLATTITGFAFLRRHRLSQV